MGMIGAEEGWVSLRLLLHLNRGVECSSAVGSSSQYRREYVDGDSVNGIL